jgi:sensor c-di-GMP phosphodiesterase-like protein
LSLDDFGTGYSSLVYPKQFPIDKLRIDQAFIRGLPTDITGAAIKRTIIAGRTSCACASPPKAGHPGTG